jgi:hypothetical protein
LKTGFANRTLDAGSDRKISALYLKETLLCPKALERENSTKTSRAIADSVGQCKFF